MYGYDAAKEADWNVEDFFQHMTFEEAIEYYRHEIYDRLCQIWDKKYRDKPAEFQTIKTEILKSKIFNIKVINANEFDISDGNIRINISVTGSRNRIRMSYDNFLSIRTCYLNMNLSHTIEFLKNFHEIWAQLDKDAYDWALHQYKEWRIKEILSQQ